MSQKFNILDGRSQTVSGKFGWAALNRAAKAERQAKETASGKSISGNNQNKDSGQESNQIHS